MDKNFSSYKSYSKLVFLLSIIILFLIMALFMTHLYNQSISSSEDSELERLFAIAKTLSYQIDGDEHEKMTCLNQDLGDIKSNSFNEVYQKYHDLLTYAQKINNLNTPIYTVFNSEICEDTNQEKFLFGVSSSGPMFRHEWTRVPEIFKDQFNAGGKILEYFTENGHWLSAFYPIQNSAGKTVGVVQVDQVFCGFVVKARADLFKNSMFAFSIIFLLGSSLLFVNRFILNSMDLIAERLNFLVNKRTKELQKSNEALNELNEKLEIKVESRTQSLTRSNNLLTKSNEKLQSFAHVVSHDLRAPLRNISSFSGLLKNNYKDIMDEEGKTFLDFISKGANEMSSLIVEILENSVPEHISGDNAIKVDLEVIFKEVETQLHHQIEEENAILKHNKLGIVMGNRSDFIQLFQNMISNSLKYCCPDYTPIIEVNYENQKGQHNLIFSDNGLGIDDEIKSKIFKEFEKSKSSGKNSFGIGLATCKKIIQEYNGKLTVHSNQQQGTKFICKFYDKGVNHELIENHRTNLSEMASS